MAEVEDLRDVVLHLQQRLGPLLGLGPGNQNTGLDPKSQSLVCLAALHALDASDPTYQSYVSGALAAGCTKREVLGTLVAVATLVGEAKAVSDARPLALALGYDVEQAIESEGGGYSRHGSDGDAR